jgi:hypothetical protein
MQINDEVIWSTLTAVVAGIILKTGDFIMNRSQNKRNREAEMIDEYHEAIQEELHSLREENRQLRARRGNLLLQRGRGTEQSDYYSCC